jgi:hypothetical protein
MHNCKWLFTVASWEERFFLGCERLINSQPFSHFFVFYFSEYAEKTAKNRMDVQKLCNKKNVAYKEILLSFDDSVLSWKSIYDLINSMETRNTNVILDISTMPRETVWSTLDILDKCRAQTFYVYHSPCEYNKDWLSRDPGKPRLVYKLGGIARLGCDTKLVILTGYDVDRVSQLINFFEPSLVLLGVQTGEQFDNITMNVEKHKAEFGNKSEIELFDINSYSDDLGFSDIKKIVTPHTYNSNIIMSSLGPKMSSISLYKFHVHNEETALAYAPSNEFNPLYSHGIGKTISGKVWD